MHQNLRKALFYTVLGYNNETMSNFARQHGITPATLCYVLSGRTKSEKIRRVVDLYIAEHLHKIKDRLDEFTKAA